YVDLVREPTYGYGKNMNPCIDCRVYMFKIAQQVMEEMNADFIITGEVLGQRPMSQRRDAMETIDRDSESEGLILRPLSAHLFPPTRPEIEGWVDREKLLNISGRSRTAQLEMAETLKLDKYTAPAGGCLLTDANFSDRLSGFFERKKNPSMTEVRLLRYGRHFDLSNGAHLILGRDQKENNQLLKESEEDVSAGKMTFFNPQFSGPVAVLSGEGSDFHPIQDESILDEAGALIAKYSKKGLSSEEVIEVKCGSETTRMRINFPLPRNPISSDGLTVTQ
ncbi:MAG: hypothetical protein ACE5FY_07495, partial [Nitrospiria bacterium]